MRQSFGRGERDVPQLNTSSLPDLIFTILFFFIVVTHMRKVTLKVHYTVPQGTELTRLTKKSAVSYVYIGTLSQQSDSTQRIQLNDKLASPSDIAGYMTDERNRMSAEDREHMMVSIKADRQTPMSLITSVKQALRKADVRRISYSAEQKKE